MGLLGGDLMQVGVAQLRALSSMAADAEGIAEVSRLSAPGLINKGLATYLGRAGSRPSAPYICRITDDGRELLATAKDGHGPRSPSQPRGVAANGPDRVERYLERAMEAERKAAMGSEEFRQEMLDAAMQWRDLAEQAAVLARA